MRFVLPVLVAALCIPAGRPVPALSQPKPTAAAMHFPGKDWQVVKPEDEGLDPDKLAAAIEHLKTNAGRDGVKELVIVRRGRIVWHGEDVDKVHGVWSCTKSFTSTALGLLIDDTKCTLDTRPRGSSRV
jgi:CubicO group peptidase (beta-lactamase class C family)